MIRMVATACVLAMICGAASAEQTARPTPAPTQAARRGRATANKPPARRTSKPAVEPVPAMAAPPEAAPAAPPAPPTLIDSAPVAPVVRIHNGQLSIDAPNSTLSDVLTAIRQATGATLEGELPTERVAVQLGPGDPRDVVSSLLQGSHYNYVILGSVQNPDAVTRIVLTQAPAMLGNQAEVTPPSSHPAPSWRPAEEAAAPRSPYAEDAEPTAEVDGNPPPQAPVTPQRQPEENFRPPRTPEEFFRALHIPLPPQQPQNEPK